MTMLFKYSVKMTILYVSFHDVKLLPRTAVRQQLTCAHRPSSVRPRYWNIFKANSYGNSISKKGMSLTSFCERKNGNRLVILFSHRPHHQPSLLLSHHPLTRSWMSWSSSFTSFLSFPWGCCCRDALHALVMLLYCLFLLVLSSWILSSRGLVLPPSKLCAIDTYSGWSSEYAAALPPSPLPAPHAPSSVWAPSPGFEGLQASFRFCFESSKYLFFEEPLWPEESPECEEAQTVPSVLLVNSCFQRSLNAASSSPAMFLYHRWRNILYSIIERCRINLLVLLISWGEPQLDTDAKQAHVLLCKQTDDGQGAAAQKFREFFNSAFLL